MNLDTARKILNDSEWIKLPDGFSLEAIYDPAENQPDVRIAVVYGKRDAGGQLYRSMVQLRDPIFREDHASQQAYVDGAVEHCRIHMDDQLKIGP
jgi:hypothetical protein